MLVKLVNLAFAALILGCLTLAIIKTEHLAGAEPKPTEVLRHVVLFKFKDGTAPDQVAEVVDAFRALKGKIPQIVDFEYGTDVSVENKAEGFTHCFFVTFADAQGRDAYLPHPAHKEFGALVGPKLDKVLVVDYWTKR